MVEKQRYLEANFDHVRIAAVGGTKNGPDTVGVLLTEAVDPRADVGVIYFVKEGYWAMCGSGTFAIGTFLVESGLVEITGPRLKITLELVTGLMQLEVDIKDGRVIGVSTVTEPVFHVERRPIEVAGFGKIEIDVAYCLNYFEPQVDATQLGLDITLRDRSKLIELGLSVREAVNKEMALEHPELPHINRAEQTLIYRRMDQGSSQEFRNVAIYGEDGFDLTPSGTSTCAFMATRHAHGQLEIGVPIRMRSVTDAVIDGRIELATTVGPHSAIVPRISGTGEVVRQTTVFS